MQVAVPALPDRLARRRRWAAGIFHNARTTGAGKSFEFVAWVAASSENHLLVPRQRATWRYAHRHSHSLTLALGAFGAAPAWIDLYESIDDGNTWRSAARCPARDPAATRRR